MKNKRIYITEKIVIHSAPDNSRMLPWARPEWDSQDQLNFYQYYYSL